MSGKTTVFITDAREAHRAAVAHKILTTPDTHLVLVLGGDHLQEGVKAIQQAVEDETLRPHYAAVEAKRLARTFMDCYAECSMVTKRVRGGSVVASQAERPKLEKLVETIWAKRQAGSGR